MDNFVDMIYNEINVLRPYFHSLREFNTEVSFDLKFPLSWDITPDISTYNLVKFKEQDKNDKTKLISYVAPKNEIGYNQVYQSILEIINNNLEREIKERLLNEKIKELRKLFQEKDLKSLENLKFDEIYERKGTERIGLSDSEGHSEDSEGNPSGQEETD